MFVHLRLHSEFSVVDATTRIDEVIQAAARDRQPALALTDLHNLFGAIKFYKQARAAGIKPLLGAEIHVQIQGQAAPTRLLLLVQNHQGYLNLCELLTRAWTRSAVKNLPVCSMQWLGELNQGLIALSGAQAGPMGQALLAGQSTEAAAPALTLANIFTHRFYIEVQRVGRRDDESHTSAAIQLAAQLQLPVVATQPVQFAAADDYEAHEARVCIAEGEMLGNPRRIRRFTREQYFKSAAQMQALFADVPSALANTVAIAQRCNLTLVLGQPRLPDFPTPDGSPITQYFHTASRQGLQERLMHRYPDDEQRAQQHRRPQRLRGPAQPDTGNGQHPGQRQAQALHRRAF